MIDLSQIERLIQNARDQIAARSTFTPTAENLVDLLGDKLAAVGPVQCIEQIRMSYGSSLINFFHSNPTREQLLNILDQTIDDLSRLRKKTRSRV